MLSSQAVETTNDLRKDPEDAEVLIELKDVWKSFGSKHILRGANIKIRRGEAVGIIGGSGTGKSTTLRLMAGLLMPDKVCTPCPYTQHLTFQQLPETPLTFTTSPVTSCESWCDAPEIMCQDDHQHCLWSSCEGAKQCWDDYSRDKYKAFTSHGCFRVRSSSRVAEGTVYFQMTQRLADCSMWGWSSRMAHFLTL